MVLNFDWLLYAERIVNINLIIIKFSLLIKKIDLNFLS